MARLSMEEFQEIKAAYLHHYMGRFNDLWDKRMLQLFDTIETQQQEIEIQTINARTYLQEAEELQVKIKQLKHEVQHWMDSNKYNFEISRESRKKYEQEIERLRRLICKIQCYLPDDKYDAEIDEVLGGVDE